MKRLGKERMSCWRKVSGENTSMEGANQWSVFQAFRFKLLLVRLIRPPWCFFSIPVLMELWRQYGPWGMTPFREPRTGISDSCLDLVRSISEVSSCFFGPRPWYIEIQHRVKRTSTINLFGFETLKLNIWRLKLWKPTVTWLGCCCDLCCYAHSRVWPRTSCSFAI